MHCEGDLKPANIIWHDDDMADCEGRWKLIDLESVLHIGSPMVEKHVGTEAYSPPELISFRLAQRDGNTMMAALKEDVGLPLATTGVDIWAFGAILFELLTGSHLLPHDISTGAMSVEECEKLQIWEEPTAIHFANVLAQSEKENRRLKAHAKDLLLKCLQGSNRS